MNGPVYIEDGQSRRRLEGSDFPLAVGGPDAAVQLTGAAVAAPVAWLGMSEGELFVQAAGGDETVVVNGQPATTSQWLHDGDVVRIAATRIVVGSDAQGTRLNVEQISLDEVTEPPLVVRTRSTDDAAAPPDVSAIQPVDFKPRPIKIERARRRFLRPATLLLWVLVGGLGALAWFVFTLHPVEVQVEPEPDRMEFVGGIFKWQLGGRHLLRAGHYTLVAEKNGYRRLEAPLKVGGDRDLSFRFRLEKLPGLLAIDTGGVAGARVRVDGEAVGVTPLEPFELSPGEHEVTVQAERYDEFATRVTIEGGEVVQTLEAVLHPQFSPITFRSEPAGATVRVDGRKVGTTPLTADLLAGKYRIEFALQGHKSEARTVRVIPDQPQTLPPAKLELADGKLVIASEPEGAAVTVNGTYRGEAPQEVYLKPGRPHEILLSKSGHERATREVRLASGQTERLTVTLEAKKGEVRVSATPSDASLFVDGQPAGVAEQVLELVAVPHELEVRKEGYEPYRTTVTPRPGFPQSIEPTLKTAAQVQAEATPAVIRTSQGQEMVLIEGGRFWMGASRREPGRRANETRHEVELTRRFYLSTMEVSNRQFRVFKSKHLSGRVGPFNLEVDHHPVVRVSWEDAALYCNWLSAKDNLPAAYVRMGSRVVPVEPMNTGYRLPTEAEWSWAARYPEGSTPLKYPWGDSLPVEPGSGNYADESANALLDHSLEGYADQYVVTAPVDSFDADARGLFNLDGNVAEWVHDVYAMRSPGSAGLERDPMGSDEGESHVIRGSSWMDSSVSELRLTYRDYGGPPRPDVGFRIARYAE